MKEAHSFESARVINWLSKSGAAGQSRSGTGVPRPVFEPVAMPSLKFVLVSVNANFEPSTCL